MNKQLIYLLSIIFLCFVLSTIIFLNIFKILCYVFYSKDIKLHNKDTNKMNHYLYYLKIFQTYAQCNINPGLKNVKYFYYDNRPIIALYNNTLYMSGTATIYDTFKDFNTKKKNL